MKIDKKKLENLACAFLDTVNDFHEKERVTYLEIIMALDYFRKFISKRAAEEAEKDKFKN